MSPLPLTDSIEFYSLRGKTFWLNIVVEQPIKIAIVTDIAKGDVALREIKKKTQQLFKFQVCIVLTL